MNKQRYAEMWAGKWFSDRGHTNDLSDAELARAFEHCVLPPHPSEYENIRVEIERLALERGLVQEGQLVLGFEM